MTNNNQSSNLPVVRINKLVYGGQGLGELPNGKKVFVWNALPDELVAVRIINQKRRYAEAIAENIIEASADRQDPRESSYLATSPWQIMDFEAENRYKKDITLEVLKQQGIPVPTIQGPIHDGQMWQYRNKMEYQFCDSGGRLSLGLYQRASHAKLAVDGSQLAKPAIDQITNKICMLLANIDLKEKDLNSIVVRSSQTGQLVASLFVELGTFKSFELPAELKGLNVYQFKQSTKMPPKLLNRFGDSSLEDTLLNKSFEYDVNSFFQVNIPVFELALQKIKDECQSGDIVDLYAGVGSIGLSIAKFAADLIERDPVMTKFAEINAHNLGIKARIIQASTDQALEYIARDKPLILDPPRTGLHDKIITKILAEKPLKIAYLSCNPITQARDLASLTSLYKIQYFEIYNFFPRTPHIETLAILNLK